ncbi:MAG: DNA-formamidopyrimidine glycosylase family protein, partial [Planctomycetota bacterium]
MPELPDIVVYLEALESRVLGETLEQIRIKSPFLLRSFDPPLSEAHGQCVTRLHRQGKRLVFSLEGDLYLVLHLMIAGRLRWRKPEVALTGRLALGAFDFAKGSLLLS